MNIIKGIWNDSQSLVLTLDDRKVTFWDDGQNCCEERYMVAQDEDLTHFIGAYYLGYEVLEAENSDSFDEWGDVTDKAFLHIRTSLGTFTIANYNSHNGYYAGFDVRCSDEPKNEWWKEW